MLKVKVSSHPRVKPQPLPASEPSVLRAATARTSLSHTPLQGEASVEPQTEMRPVVVPTAQEVIPGWDEGLKAMKALVGLLGFRCGWEFTLWDLGGAVPC